jgi:hypothetical protein
LEEWLKNSSSKKTAETATPKSARSCHTAGKRKTEKTDSVLLLLSLVVLRIVNQLRLRQKCFNLGTFQSNYPNRKIKQQSQKRLFLLL